MSSFNPHTRTGCDEEGYRDFIERSVSIHAPARGATDMDDELITKYGVSIHAPARGATP